MEDEKVVLNKVARCSRCPATLSAEEIRNGWLCAECVARVPQQRQCNHRTYDTYGVNPDLNQARDPGGCRRYPCCGDWDRCRRRLSDDAPEGFVAGGSFEVKYDSGPTREECMKKLEQVKFGPRRECPLCFVDLTPANSWLHTVQLPDCIKTISTCSSERCLAWAYRVQDDAKAMRERAMQVDTSGAPVAKAPSWDRHCANCQSDVTPATIVAHVLQWVDGSREVIETCDAESCLTWAKNCVALAADTHPDRLLIAKAPTAERMPDTLQYLANKIACPDPELQRIVEADLLGGMFTHESAVAALRERLSLPASPPPRPDGFSQSAIDAAKAVLLSTTKRGGK